MALRRTWNGSRNLGMHDCAWLTEIARYALHALYLSKLGLLAKPTQGGAFKVRAPLPPTLFSKVALG
jgi:hypothetical protein